MAEYGGVVKARIIEARFALSGKIAIVNHHAGDTVKKWGIIASLDRKILQTELDSELSDYEKVRADFEIFGQKNPNPITEIDKYLKTQKNAELNGSVKSVEIAKAQLDMADLFSPVDGVIVDDSDIVPGLFITPAGATVKIVDTHSFYVEVEIEEKDVKLFSESKKVKVTFPSDILGEIEGETSPVISDGKRFFVKIPISGVGLLIGLTSKISF